MIPNEIKPKFTNLANTLGGMGQVGKLPNSTLVVAATHPDDIIGITTDQFVFELTDIQADYEVFDKTMRFLYAADHSDGKWGFDQKDLILLVQLKYGEFFYIGYETSDEERLVMVIKG